MSSVHFLYHELRPEPSRYAYVVPCDLFEAHCTLYARMHREEKNDLLRPEITFDDGHRSDLQYAHPILAEHGLRATFFITAGWTGQRPEYMNFAELRELSAAGHRIGAHGLTHKLLTGCTERELDEELRGARARLEDGLGIEVRTMSLPGGRVNARVLGACEEAGFQRIFTSVPRSEAMASSPRTIGRLNLTATASVPWLERVLDPGSGVLSRLERIDRVKGAAKAVLGDRLYARIWALGNRQDPDAAQAEAVVS